MGERSRQLFQEAARYFPGGVNSPVRAFGAVGGEPFFVAHALGSRLTDADGRTYIDYVGSWGPMILGHAHPRVVAAIQAAAEAGTSYGAPDGAGDAPGPADPGRLSQPGADALRRVRGRKPA